MIHTPASTRAKSCSVPLLPHPACLAPCRFWVLALPSASAVACGVGSLAGHSFSPRPESPDLYPASSASAPIWLGLHLVNGFEDSRRRAARCGEHLTPVPRGAMASGLQLRDQPDQRDGGQACGVNHNGQPWPCLDPGSMDKQQPLGRRDAGPVPGHLADLLQTSRACRLVNHRGPRTARNPWRNVQREVQSSRRAPRRRRRPV